MALVNLDLVGPYGIAQGYEWRLAIYYPGNALNSNLWGQLWRRHDPGSKLASFAFERQGYDPVQKLTKLAAVLDPFTTARLATTGGSYYVYEIQLDLPREAAKQLLAGKVHVYPSLYLLR